MTGKIVTLSFTGEKLDHQAKNVYTLCCYQHWALYSRVCLTRMVLSLYFFIYIFISRKVRHLCNSWPLVGYLCHISKLYTFNVYEVQTGGNHSFAADIEHLIWKVTTSLVGLALAMQWHTSLDLRKQGPGATWPFFYQKASSQSCNWIGEF